MYLVVMFDADGSVDIVHSNWLTDGNRGRWPKSSTFQAYQRMLLEGGYLPETVPAFDFYVIYHTDNLRDTVKFERNFLAESGMSESMDNTLPMTSFSRRYTVCRRHIVICYHIPFRIPVPLLSDDSSAEIPPSQRIRRESPIQSPDCPGDIMALGHSTPSPQILGSQKRSKEDATLSNVAGPSTKQLVTTPLSPQHMPAYANKWQGNFLIISCYNYQTTSNVCCQT
ncbi:hypothetical protein FGIG_12041 [Fasciola gigantica]|uniref:Uncharacterized protein n=1 Tax=Fasciola gigantica TaxID=46835 RepID=A0A504YBW4_FASGI|nr:hypothetical protein FGIG_12041 [Fasciola gigantica]